MRLKNATSTSIHNQISQVFLLNFTFASIYRLKSTHTHLQAFKLDNFNCIAPPVDRIRNFLNVIQTFLIYFLNLID